MTTHQPLVSVVMPCYNGEAFLREAIDSVLEQSLQDLELIVVNDGSTDGSRAILDAYGSRITVIDQANRGLPAARNAGVRRASGRLVAFLDCDDFWHVDFLARMTAALQAPGVVLAYCGWQNVGTRDGKPYIPPDYETQDKLDYFLRREALWPVHAAMVYREALPGLEPFDENLRSCEDYDLWLKLAVLNPIRLVPQVLAYYRQHEGGQMTANHARIGYYNLFVKERFLNAHPEVRSRLDLSRLRAYRAGPFLKRGYRALWGGDIKSAHWIFRYALRRGFVGLKDLKYALPTLLPYTLYSRLLKTRGLASPK